MRGIDPRTSRMQSERSTIWATSPLRKGGATALSNLSSVMEIVEQSPLLHIVVILALSVRVINPCVSHMPIAYPPDWHASLVVSKGVVYVRRMSLIVLSVEFLLHSASFWGEPWRFGALIDFSASSVLFQMLPFAYWTYKSLSSFGLTKQLPVFPFFNFRTPLKNWRCGASIPVHLACKASALPSELRPRWGNGKLLPRKPFLCFWNSWTESSIAYRCNMGFVDAGHQSMCFSHASRLPFPIDMPRWWGPKELFMSDGCLWFSYQYSNVSSDVFLR